MEPTEPIRGGQQSGLPRYWRFFRSWKEVVFFYLDTWACFLALFGLALTALFLASFNPKIRSEVIGPFPRPDIGVRTAVGVAIFLAMSAACFSYMLWRYRWRYRLITLFKIALFWGVTLAAITVDVKFTIYAGILVIMLYAFIWSFRLKKLRE